MTRKCFACGKKKKLNVKKLVFFRGHWFCKKHYQYQSACFNAWRIGKGEYAQVYEDGNKANS